MLDTPNVTSSQSMACQRVWVHR